MAGKRETITFWPPVDGSRAPGIFGHANIRSKDSVANDADQLASAETAESTPLGPIGHAEGAVTDWHLADIGTVTPRIIADPNASERARIAAANRQAENLVVSLAGIGDKNQGRR